MPDAAQVKIKALEDELARAQQRIDAATHYSQGHLEARIKAERERDAGARALVAALAQLDAVQAPQALFSVREAMREAGIPNCEISKGVSSADAIRLLAQQRDQARREVEQIKARQEVDTLRVRVLDDGATFEAEVPRNLPEDVQLLAARGLLYAHNWSDVDHVVFVNGAQVFCSLDSMEPSR